MADVNDSGVDTADLVQAVSRWCVDPARYTEPADRYLHPFVALLNEMGLEIGSATFFVRTIHPQLEMVVERWRPATTEEIQLQDASSVQEQYQTVGDQGVVEMYLLAHGHSDAAMYLESPFYLAHQKQDVLRWRLKDHADPPRFPIFTDLLERGDSEYLVTPLVLPKPYVGALSLSTHAPNGFPDGIDEAIRQLAPFVSLSAAHKVENLTFREILSAYLGRNAAREVSRGNVQLGDLRSMDAVIGFADLRGFTELTQRSAHREFIFILSLFFAELDHAIRSGGGEILKFMGDGALFVFPCQGRDDEEVCRRALGALAALSESIGQSEATFSEAGIRYAAALHRGKVRFGNIGAPARLDFTVVGPCVHKTERLQEVAARANRDLVMSQEVADLVPDLAVPLGAQDPGGGGELADVFVLA